ncbi:MAG: conjugal transfer protein TrbI, partial [Piscirickettsiaceae bacterium]
GEAVLKTEQRAGLAPLPAMTIDQPFRSDHLLDAMRSERIRQAQKALQAQEAPVFFQLSQGKPSDPDRGQLSEPSALMKEAPKVAPDNGISGAQDHKLDFLKTSPKGTIYNAHSLQDPVSPYQVMAGTVIAASLITGLNSDLPGEIIAQVTEPVYDTVTGGYLLIPQGSRLLGRYDSTVAFGQDRALVVWQRLLLPDGSSMVLDNLPATDPSGFAGLTDQVDFHSWALIKGTGLSTILSIGSELAFQNTDSNLLKAVQRGSQDNINKAGQAIVERNLNIPPTIKIRPGFPLRVIVHKDIILRPYVSEGGNND